jgi:hypothetical protein
MTDEHDSDTEAVTFEVASFPFMAEEPGAPFAVITTARHDRTVVERIERHPNGGADIALADALIDAWRQSPADFTVGRIALSYGWMKQIGGPVEPEVVDDPPRSRRARVRLDRG